MLTIRTCSFSNKYGGTSVYYFHGETSACGSSTSQSLKGKRSTKKPKEDNNIELCTYNTVDKITFTAPLKNYLFPLPATNASQEHALLQFALVVRGSKWNY